MPVWLREKLLRLGLFCGDMLFPDLTNTLRVLRDRGFQPDFAIDIGAYHGNWTRDLLLIFPDCRVLMIEAQEKKAAGLRKFAAAQSGRVELEIRLLGPTDNLDVTFVEMETGSSVFEEKSGFSRERVQRRTTSLDDLLETTRRTQPISLLKLDVQGYELEVLKGASAALKRAEFVLLETSLIAVNQGCPLMLEVMQFMDQHGFTLYDWCSQVRRPDRVLWQVDLLFVACRSELLPVPRYWH